MRVIDIAGRMQTAGTWEKTAEAEADAQALLRHTRAGLRRMLDGNEQFHVDPMAARLLPACKGKNCGCTDGRSHSAECQAEHDAATGYRHEPAPKKDTRVQRRPHYGVDGWLIDGMFYTCDADGWISNTPTPDAVCPVPDGVEFEARCRRGQLPSYANNRHSIWWELLARQHAQDVIAWRPIISADTPLIADWRPGDQVPGAKRTGLWHFKDDDGSVCCARAADNLTFRNVRAAYRPAAPGVREGEAYDEARYGVAG